MRITLGMSGGVDSSVAALLLQRAGHDVTGFFMLNWEDDDPESGCHADTDRKDALVVPKANAPALASAINTLLDSPELAARLAAEARQTGARYDIGAFVRKMERL